MSMPIEAKRGVVVSMGCFSGCCGIVFEDYPRGGSSRSIPLTDLALLWLRCGHQEFCTRIAVEQFQQVAQRHRVLVGCAAASMRYHDEIRVFSRLMAKSVVGNNQ
jgi:hypothetical protein